MYVAGTHNFKITCKYQYEIQVYDLMWEMCDSLYGYSIWNVWSSVFHKLYFENDSIYYF